VGRMARRHRALHRRSRSRPTWDIARFTVVPVPVPRGTHGASTSRCSPSFTFTSHVGHRALHRRSRSRPTWDACGVDIALFTVAPVHVSRRTHAASISRCSPSFTSHVGRMPRRLTLAQRSRLRACCVSPQHGPRKRSRSVRRGESTTQDAQALEKRTRPGGIRDVTRRSCTIATAEHFALHHARSDSRASPCAI
jgi:hypothetical protein